MRMALATDDNIFSYLTEAEMTMHAHQFRRVDQLFLGEIQTLKFKMA